MSGVMKGNIPLSLIRQPPEGGSNRPITQDTRVDGPPPKCHPLYGLSTGEMVNRN